MPNKRAESAIIEQPERRRRLMIRGDRMRDGIEEELALLSATAIEPGLQDGVPEMEQPHTSQ